MSITQLSPAGVTALTRTTLALDVEAHSTTDAEMVAASIRRAASFLCPLPPAGLIAAVRDVLAPLHDGEEHLRDLISTHLENLLGTGDLLELRQSDGRAGRLIFLGPPTFVERHPGQYLLLGVRAEGRPLIEGDIAARVHTHGHLRTISLQADRAPALLKDLGLHELPVDRWLRHPAVVTASQYLSDARTRLDAARVAGRIQGLEILDPTRPVHYYTKRWRQLEASDVGDFLGRRPQAYGAAAWCFVRVSQGKPDALLDLSSADPVALPRDEAWRLQAAIDAERGIPQLFRLTPSHDGSSLLDVYSPIPSWVERSLSIFGEPVERGRGALLSYHLPAAAVPSAERLLTDMLWMKPTTQGGQA